MVLEEKGLMDTDSEKRGFGKKRGFVTSVNVFGLVGFFRHTNL